MKPKEDLHQLIQSMSMSEKRYFHIYSSRHTVGEVNNYQRLFDFIAKQERYDEAEVKKYFKGETFIHHLPSEKNYLYYQVLDSLNSFHREKTFLSRHSAKLATIEMLFQRGLFHQCKALIKRQKKEAYLLEKFSVLLLLLRWETLVFIKDEDDKNLNKSIWEELRVLEVMRVQTVLTQIAFNIQIQIDKGHATPAFIRESERELKKNLPANLQVSSFWTKYYYHSSIGLLSSLRKDQKKRLRSFIEIKSIMDNSPQFIRDLPGIYHTNFNNMVNVMLLLEKYGEAEKIISLQKNFLTHYKIRNIALSKIILVNTLESELFLLYKTKRWNEATSLVKEAEPELKRLDQKFSPLLYDLYFMMSVVEFKTRNFKSAGKWLNRILNMEHEVHLRKELSINARLLYLLIMYESHDVLFDTRLRATKRYLQQERQFTTHLKIGEVIRLLADGNAGAKKKTLLRRYVSEIRSEMKIATEESLNKQFDFAEWIDEQIVIVQN
ncbi:MAG TPA: hypothetical protein VL651_05815 [Bacteroidia bacterium]|jgi:hypothetical protein|nr:hypothetical protein [Bacteroidia bacterium]